MRDQANDFPRVDFQWRREVLLGVSAGRFDAMTDGLSAEELAALFEGWEFHARIDQLPPLAAADGGPWTTWLAIGGRGAGKTRAGAQWVRGLALGLPGFAHRPPARIALVGETAQDVREVMIEGVSGVLAVHQSHERPLWEPSRRRLTWPNGVIAQAFSAEDPAALRGPQFEAAWCDELAKWRHDEAAWDMLQFCLRLGRHPRQMVTTTPRPTKLIKRLLADPRTAVTRAKTFDNRAHLAPEFLERVVARYEGTRLGRQELLGEIVEDVLGALWSRATIEAARGDTPEALARIVVAVDPPATSGKRADSCGIVAAGLDSAGLVHVLADASFANARPAQWAQAAAALYHRLEADALVAEVNQGDEMVAAVLAEADKSIPVRMVRASRGKYLRAAPVAQLYEQGRVRHAGAFPQLEDEMCAFGPEGLAGGKSPDRLDALVWAVSALTAGTGRAAPRVRAV